MVHHGATLRLQEAELPAHHLAVFVSCIDAGDIDTGERVFDKASQWLDVWAF